MGNVEGIAEGQVRIQKLVSQECVSVSSNNWRFGSSFSWEVWASAGIRNDGMVWGKCRILISLASAPDMPWVLANITSASDMESSISDRRDTRKLAYFKLMLMSHSYQDKAGTTPLGHWLNVGIMAPCIVPVLTMYHHLIATASQRSWIRPSKWEKFQAWPEGNRFHSLHPFPSDKRAIKISLDMG